MFDVALKDAFAKMDGLRRVAVLPFHIFPHVHEHGFGILLQSLTCLVDGDLLYSRPCFVDDLEKSRRMFHVVTIGRVLLGSNTLEDQRAASVPLANPANASETLAARSQLLFGASRSVGSMGRTSASSFPTAAPPSFKKRSPLGRTIR